MNFVTTTRRLRNISSNPNSLMVTIPKYFVDTLNLRPNQEVEISLTSIKNKKITITVLEEEEESKEE